MITDRNAHCSLISREEMRIRLSRWTYSAVYTGLICKMFNWELTVVRGLSECHRLLCCLNKSKSASPSRTTKNQCNGKNPRRRKHTYLKYEIADGNNPDSDNYRA
jgi:hypothetical protein